MRPNHPPDLQRFDILRWPLDGGSGWEVGSSASIINGNATLRINDDGTWTMTGRPNGGAALEYSGTSTVNGNRVILSAANGRRWMSLALNGRRLYGPAMVNSRRVMLEFIRVEAPGTRRHAACRSNFVPSTGSVK